ncbi:type II toxin-antitoxin system VapC family toxin [Rivularia sp. UHCC 0363]|uniref:type II toxin-antitoxin system VapC family toxin n=1 Tax=Rivularia sp. UHCC 0363 TaxID=3110244 RepID=UPI002B1E9AA0|nr:type II toxin-antitoxin system VapC family toxin [Rivularia sp. UHCC 0363]MEA5593747.1 type II toxin-antitoxin system VapC family toxin [Rivularia sp. UHCC 0363]
MKLLLDTHTFIWFVIDSPQLSSNAKTLIEDEYNEKFFSIASIWEMAIKQSLGKLTFNLPLQTFVRQQMEQNSMALLNIEIDHVTTVATMQLHHKDPFDRLLIAQAMVEQLPVIGVDSAFDAYSIQRIW